MSVPFVVTIRTANRAPRKNYLGETVRAFLAGGCDPWLIHLFPTDPDIAWLSRELEGSPVVIHAPNQARTPNENGLAQVQALDQVDAEWIWLFEDDLAFCADPLGSMQRWLADQARPDVHVYRFFALPKTPVIQKIPGAMWTPLREMRGSQAVALRSADARDLAAWGVAHPRDWRPRDAPFQQYPTKGFDKLIGYWALQRWPEQHFNLVSRPMLVQHIGVESLLHHHGLKNDAMFGGKDYRYGEATT